MPLIIVAIIMLTISYFFPRLSNVLAWALTLTFIIPFCTFGCGTFAWVIANILTECTFWGWSDWWGFCTFAGLPIGLVAAWWIHAD